MISFKHHNQQSFRLINKQLLQATTNAVGYEIRNLPIMIAQILQIIPNIRVYNVYRFEQIIKQILSPLITSSIKHKAEYHRYIPQIIQELRDNRYLTWVETKRILRWLGFMISDNYMYQYANANLRDLLPRAFLHFLSYQLLFLISFV